MRKRPKISPTLKRLTPVSLGKLVAKYYLQSDDFNGLAYHHLTRLSKFKVAELRDVIIESIKARVIDLVFQFPHPNPHIKAFAPYAPEKQLTFLDEVIAKDESFCLYPTPSVLKDIVNPKKYAGKPYSMELALGAPQLEFRTFETWVLEQYRTDARFEYHCTDIAGHISIKQKSVEDGHVQVRDATFLKQFGFAYLSKKGQPVRVADRVVAVYLRYISDFTPEHQQHWKSRQLDGEYMLQPDYYRATIRGQFPEGMYIYQALLLELRTINALLERVGEKHLFKQDWVDDPLPGLAILLRPTRQHYLDFAQLLDKVLSENIDLDFFPADIPREIETPQKDGKIRVERRGSIALLEDWMGKNFIFDAPYGSKDVADGLRTVRSERMPQAHRINEDVHDPKFYEMQRDLIKTAYRSIASIRDILMAHPDNADYELPHALSKGKIRTI